MRSKKLLIAASAAVICLSGILASSASARSPYGPTGLGANLHRRFIIKQGFKQSRRGRAVANRQIIHLSRPYTYGFIRTRGRW